MITFHIITLFPNAFDSYLKESIIARAIKDKKIKVSFYNPRDFTPRLRSGRAENARRRVDQKPYGGGPGMVIEALPILKAVEKAKGRKKKVKVIFLTPAGVQFNNSYAKKVSKGFKDVVIISGRYEGIDERVKKMVLPAQRKYAFFVSMAVIEMVWLLVMCGMAFF